MSAKKRTREEEEVAAEGLKKFQFIVTLSGSYMYTYIFLFIIQQTIHQRIF